MQRHTDRRVRRTQELLHQSLIALILEKGYGRITVQDILDRADVGRSTFYAHYQGKDDLLLANGMEHLQAMFAAAGPVAEGGPVPLLRPVLALFRLVHENRRLYRGMVGERGSELIVRSVRRLWSQLLTEHLRGRLVVSDEGQLEVVVEFVVSGMMGLLTWWLDTKAPLSANEMYARFEHLAVRGLGPLMVENASLSNPPFGRPRTEQATRSPSGPWVRQARPADRQADDLDSLASEDLIEGSAELGVVVPEQEPGSKLTVL
jgi:AcrR family transcriptional regulator